MAPARTSRSTKRDLLEPPGRNGWAALCRLDEYRRSAAFQRAFSPMSPSSTLCTNAASIAPRQSAIMVRRNYACHATARTTHAGPYSSGWIQLLGLQGAPECHRTGALHGTGETSVTTDGVGGQTRPASAIGPRLL